MGTRTVDDMNKSQINNNDGNYEKTSNLKSQRTFTNNNNDLKGSNTNIMQKL